MIARLLFLAALLVSVPSWSLTPPLTAIAPTVVQSGSSYVVTYPTATPSAFAELMSRIYTPSQLSSGAVEVRDALTARGPAGNLSLVSARTVTASSVAAGLARIASRAIVPLAVGSLAYELLSSQGVKQGSSGAEIDEGADPTPKDTWKTSANCGGKYTSSGYVANIGQGGSGSTAISSCQSQKSNSEYIPLGCSDGYLYPNGTQYSMQCSYRTGVAPNGYITTESISAYKTSVLGCPDAIDASSGQSYTPGTFSNGKCMTGRYSAATPIEVEARVLPAVSSNTNALTNGIKAVLAALGSLTASPPVVTGPASQTGTPATTTTTGPAGTTSTTTTPTYQYNYAGDTITYNTTNQTITNTTSPTGETTTETKTETKPEPADTKQLCDTYPDSLACLKPGTPAEPEAIPVDRKTITITPDTARWQPNAGGCTRAAIQLVSGPTLDLWKPFCDFFHLIRGVVIGMFGIAGSFLFRNGIR